MGFNHRGRIGRGPCLARKPGRPAVISQAVVEVDKEEVSKGRVLGLQLQLDPYVDPGNGIFEPLPGVVSSI